MVEAVAGGHSIVRQIASALRRRSGFQWQVKRNVFSRKEGKSSSSNNDVSRKTPGYCWRIQKCRNVCIPYACFEGKKAWKTCARKSTSRTLKEIRQQYPPDF